MSHPHYDEEEENVKADEETLSKHASRGKRYSPSWATAEITYTDGEVKTFEVSASPNIAQYLMREAASTGVLVLRNDQTREVLCVPMAQIRELRMNHIQPQEVTP